MKIFLSLIVLFISLSGHALDPSHFTINRITAPYFIVDGNSTSTITTAYVGFEVKNNSNSGVTYSGLQFTITSIGTTVVGQNYSVVSPASGVVNVGTLAPGATKVCYYYVSYPANVTPQATFNVSLTDYTATSKTQSFVIRNRSSISANAGGAATQTFSNQDLIGGIITDDVTYAVGNVQSGDESDFQVAVSSQFDPTKVSLLSTQVISSTVPLIAAGATDSLYFVTGNGSNGATVTIRWTFRITGFNFTTYLLPCAGATSGSTNYKYALNTSLGSGTPVTVSSTANPLTITKTSDKALYGLSSLSRFTVTIQNPGAYGVTIDKITDQLPAGFVFLALDGTSQVTSANSTGVPQAGATGTINFLGGVTSGVNTSYYIPAAGTFVLKYNATSAVASASNLQTTVSDFVGTTLVGSAQNTVSVSSTLPVKLVSFDAYLIKEGIGVTWTTSEQINVARFEIERCNGTVSFKKIGEMKAYGNTSNATSYEFKDLNPYNGRNYYRLKSIDNDNKFVYSMVVSVESVQKNIRVQSAYPNPFTDYTRITIVTAKDLKVSLLLSDINGAVLNAGERLCKKGETVIKLDQLGRLGGGAYIIKVISEEGIVEQKLIKIR